MTYWAKLQDPRWQRKRLEVLERDAFTCQQCGSTDKVLHVHHCYYLKGREPWEQGTRDTHMFKSLCDACHEERQSMEHDIRLEFSRLMAQLNFEQLDNLMLDLLETSKSDVVNGITVSTNTSFAIEADFRWYLIACEHPLFRPFYEQVTGNHPDWK